MAFVYMACMCMLQMQKHMQNSKLCLFCSMWNEMFGLWHVVSPKMKLSILLQTHAIWISVSRDLLQTITNRGLPEMLFVAHELKCWCFKQNVLQVAKTYPKLNFQRNSLSSEFRLQFKFKLIFCCFGTTLQVLMFQGEILNRRKHTSNLSCCRFALSFYFRLFHRAQRQITDLFMKNKGPFATNEDFDKAPHVYDPLTIWNGLPWFALRVGASFLNQNPKSLETPKKPRAQARANVLLFVPCNGGLLKLHSFIPG